MVSVNYEQLGAFARCVEH